ncbi:hypothetical protein [Thermoactinomyces sp. DSM 45892]|uniref:hypothetical protein n=1 Tax=Thermoactinomyces sp. DSM 45892 TaxID=1882753 RepID=UPI0008961AA9|nr:hypothetical protein [Thermoactinomyces sp. DSM 45892]SDY86518.1 hypothetical protein SAMN05444416_109111 [Thermoactinomyces sp. DSM 45892]
MTLVATKGIDIDLERIRVGYPESLEGLKGTIIIDRIIVGVCLGWQVRYCGDVISTTRKEEEVLGFLRANKIPQEANNILPQVKVEHIT